MTRHAWPQRNCITGCYFIDINDNGSIAGSARLSTPDSHSFASFVPVGLVGFPRSVTGDKSPVYYRPSLRDPATRVPEGLFESRQMIYRLLRRIAGRPFGTQP